MVVLKWEKDNIIGRCGVGGRVARERGSGREGKEGAGEQRARLRLSAFAKATADKYAFYPKTKNFPVSRRRRSFEFLVLGFELCRGGVKKYISICIYTNVLL